jgi:hypothetical protein
LSALGHGFFQDWRIGNEKNRWIEKESG